MSMTESSSIDTWSRQASDEEQGEPPIIETKKTRGQGPLLPIERDPKHNQVYVLDSVVPLRPEPGPETPKDNDFRHFTIDKTTLLVIDKIATAVEMHSPCLLEGETSTSKTSSIQYLANRTNHEVIRANMNGQSDTSELIGKFVPNDGQLRLSFKQMLEHPELLKETSRAIIAGAQAKKRALTMFESQQIADLQNLKVPDWRWQDGVIPRAMREGKWVILDEINLAEPQILERINPVLERNPSLTITEDSGQKIEAGSQDEAALHPDFRIFATMNPAEYQGRSPMSPAYKDRWTSYLYATRPTQADWLAMGMNVVYGEQPKVTIRDQAYQAPDSEPIDRVREVPNFREFLERLATVQTKIEELSRTRSIGKGNKEPFVFTRRGLIEFFQFLSTKTLHDRARGKTKDILTAPKEIIQRALEDKFSDKVAKSEEDRKKVDDLLDTNGIGPTQWAVEFTKEAEEEYLAKATKRSNEKGEKDKELYKAQEFTDLSGVKIMSTGKTKILGRPFRVGDILKVSGKRSVIDELRVAKKIQVVGVVDSWGDKDYIIQIDGDRCLLGRENEDDLYIKKPK